MNRHAHDITDRSALGKLVNRFSHADCVLLGEASHGTSEYYRWRAQITANLPRDHGFSFAAVEGDWTSCYELNRFCKDVPDAPRSAEAALRSFDRWPTWIWANWEIEGFAEWIRTMNQGRPLDERAGFYGLDVYGLYESLQAVLDYLKTVDSVAAEETREAHRCFEPYGEDAHEYARATRIVRESCEEEVAKVLQELREGAAGYAGGIPDDQFAAEQNALIARNAEEYYRAMVGGKDDSWNIRDRHMAETLDRLLEHHGPDAAGIVWAHNTHVGDARATDMPSHGRINIGQLAREQDTIDDVFLVGFGCHHGKVIAGDAWGASMEEMRVPESRAESYEQVFHRSKYEKLLLFSDDPPAGSELEEPRGNRAIGVVYDPEREAGNYVPTVFPRRYDAFLHIEETTALHPLELHPGGKRVPELYPTGF